MTPYTFSEIRQLRHASYTRGVRAGALLMAIVAGLIFIAFNIEMQARLADEAKATNYYYSLTENQ